MLSSRPYSAFIEVKVQLMGILWLPQVCPPLSGNDALHAEGRSWGCQSCMQVDDSCLHSIPGLGILHMWKDICKACSGGFSEKAEHHACTLRRGLQVLWCVWVVKHAHQLVEVGCKSAVWALVPNSGPKLCGGGQAMLDCHE